MGRSIILAVVVAALSLSGCGPGTNPTPDACAITGDGGVASVELGVPDPITFLDYANVDSAGHIPVSSNGQTFLAVQLALRGQGFNDRIQVGLRVMSDATGASTELLVGDAPVDRFRCRDDGFRYLVPIAVSTEGLGDESMLQDTPVTADVTVRDQDGAMATATVRGVLERL